MLLISLVLAVIPLAGIAWIAVTKSITSVDGLFMSLILLTLSGVFFLSALIELKAKGWLGAHKKAAGAQKATGSTGEPQP